MDTMRPDSAEQATLASQEPPPGAPEAEQVVQDAHALAAEFESLCFEFTSPDHAREYGTDWDRESAGACGSNDAENQNAPKKGSLRVFAQQVVSKVSRKGCTTYQSIADELISELQAYKRQQASEAQAKPPANKRRRTADASAAAVEGDDGEKNIRRRVYDSLNVLKAVGAVIPMKGLTGSTAKEVLWVGLPSGLEDVHAATDMQEELKQHVRAVQQTHEQVQALASQYELLCNLIDRNAAQRAGGEQRDDEAVVPLPFILLQAGPQAAMDVRLSTDECDALLDYGSPFQVLEDYIVLQKMGLEEPGLEVAVA